MRAMTFDRFGTAEVLHETERIRFAVEVAAAVADEIGPDRAGIRISPANPFNDIAEDDTAELYPTLIEALAPLNLAYLHVVHAGNEELIDLLRKQWPTSSSSTGPAPTSPPASRTSQTAAPT